MNGFDIAILVLIGIGAITGLLRGLVQEVLALLAWIAGVFAVYRFHTPLSEALVPHLETETGAAVLAFMLLLLVPLMIGMLLARYLSKMTRDSVVNPLDRMLGFGFGMIKGTIIAVVAYSIMVLAYDTVWSKEGRPLWVTQARSYPMINEASEKLVKMIAEHRRAQAEADAKADEGKGKKSKKKKRNQT